MIEKKVSEGLTSWRGADLTLNLYLGYFDINTSHEEVKSGIESQGVNVVELEELRRQHNRFKSFRLCIRKKDMDQVKESDFWPEGVVLRKFFQKLNRDGVTDTSNNNNGSNQ